MSTFDRTLGIGATDARHILSGDWHQLWLEKTKRAQPENLDDLFRAQLGKVTEAFHIEWLGKRQGLTVESWSFSGELARQHDVANPWRYVTVDGFDFTNRVPIEVKHSHSQANIREAADHYMPQLQHNLSITGAPWLWFSVIPGNEEPMTVKVERDQEYIDRLLELERQFWWHVTEDVAPDIIPTADIARTNALADHILVGGYKKPVDMTRHNQWVDLALEYIELQPKAKRCEQVNKELKALVPDDCAGAYGHGLTVTRNKKGQLTLRFEKETA